MNNYKCTKCDETMTSKCPATRNIFPSDGVASMMTNITNVMTRKDPDTGKRTVTIEFPYVDTHPEWDSDKIEMECVRILRGLTDDQVTHWLCDHVWKRVETEEAA